MSDFIDTDIYLLEKTLLALQNAVQLIDLINDPLTSRWYKVKLRTIAESMIQRLVPIVVFAADVDQQALEQAEIQKLLDGGSFALKRWCREWKIKDPAGTAFGSIRHLEVVDAESDEGLDRSVDLSDSHETEEEQLNLKVVIYAAMVRWLLNDDFSESQRKLLLWLLRGLQNSERADTVSVSKRFLPTDLGLSAEDVAMAYRSLQEKNIIEVVSNSGETSTDRLVVKLIVDGINESREDRPFEEVVFGGPGVRINGEPTVGETVSVKLPPTLKSRQRWSTFGHDNVALKSKLQEYFGEEKLFIETVNFVEHSGEILVDVSFRYPLSTDRKVLIQEIKRSVISLQ